jgi:hypothetical protein
MLSEIFYNIEVYAYLYDFFMTVPVSYNDYLVNMLVNIVSLIKSFIFKYNFYRS